MPVYSDLLSPFQSLIISKSTFDEAELTSPSPTIVKLDRNYLAAVLPQLYYSSLCFASTDLVCQRGRLKGTSKHVRSQFLILSCDQLWFGSLTEPNAK